ncbi:MAG: hypothetical protein C4292_06635 [Nitrososphaera sp.]
MLGENAELHSVPDIGTADLIVTFELAREAELKQENLPAIYFHRYAQSENVWPATVEAAKQWMETWPTRPAYKGQSLLEVLRFEDTSLWWFIYDVIWETKNGIFDTFYQVGALASMVQVYKPLTVELWGTFDFNAKEIMAALAMTFRFDLKVTDYKLKAAPQGELASSTGKLRLLARFVLLKVARIFARRAGGKNKRPIAFFLNHGSSAVEKRLDGKLVVSDHYLEGLEGYMAGSEKGGGDSKIFVSMNIPRPTSSYYKNLLIELGRTARGTYTPWLCYFSLGDLQTRQKLVWHYQKVIAELENDPKFRESMVIEGGVDIYPMLRDTLRGSLPKALALVHSEILVARKFINKERPRMIFHTAGVSASGRAVSLPCRQQNIRMVAPQLGIISSELPVNTGFLITKGYDKRLLTEYLVWGQFYKAMVTARGYPDSLVKVVGFWRTAKKEAGEKALQGGKGQEGQQQTLPAMSYVLYVAGANLGKLSYILSFDEEIATIKMIQKAMPDGLSLVVKLHPSLPYDPYFKSLHGVDRVVLVGGPGALGIEEFLPAARVVLGKASTVLVQALILGKPVIVVNFASKLDFLGFRGVPFATSIEEFEASMKDILSGSNPLQERGFDLEYYCEATGSESISLITKEVAGKR